MANIKVSVINHTTVLTNKEIRAAMPAFQTQVSKHFAPVWGIDADLVFVGKGKHAAHDSWWLSLLDDSPLAGVMGYHERTPFGLPLGKSFARTDKKFGDSWTVTASHELLEMLADPDINCAASFKDFHLKRPLQFYAREVCDPCQDDQYAYQIGETLVSDFVFPTYYESFRKGTGAQFDFMRKIQAPFQVLPGGYITLFNPNDGKGWTQVKVQPQNGRKARGSRVVRRRKPRGNWKNTRLRLRPLLERRAKLGLR